ncbi:hypothetical protein HZB78_03195 [Candidatus Collierbacteria bacterium]|nr:hypothetical protein [Candidatus Collierbacteria bacterium]
MRYIELTDLDLRLEAAIVEEAGQIGLNAKLNFYSLKTMPTAENLPSPVPQNLSTLLIQFSSIDVNSLPITTLRRMAIGWQMTFGLGEPPEAIEKMTEKMLGEAYAHFDSDGLSTMLLNIRLVDPDMF